jgi:tetrahydrodipicolinate N-succinyltransferase
MASANLCRILAASVSVEFTCGIGAGGGIGGILDPPPNNDPIFIFS